jgi:hypothetical protein
MIMMSKVDTILLVFGFICLILYDISTKQIIGATAGTITGILICKYLLFREDT